MCSTDRSTTNQPRHLRIACALVVSLAMASCSTSRDDPPVNDPLVAVASPVTGDAPLDVTFSAGIRGNLPLRWDLGDGTRTNGGTVAHRYEQAGTYTITVSHEHDQEQVVLNTLSVHVNAPPEPGFTVAHGDTPLEVYVDAAGSVDLDGSIVQYAWDFGDGGTANARATNHAYANPGTYLVTLRVTDDSGSVATLAQDVDVDLQDALPRLRISDDGRYLMSGDTPFLWHADTAWMLWRTALPGDVDRYLDDAAAHGFNVVQTFLMSMLRRPNAALDEGQNVFGDPPFVDNDPTRLDAAYFDYVEYVIDAAASRGLYTVVVYGEPGRYNNQNSGEGTLLPYRIESVQEAYDYAFAVGERLRRQARENKIIWFNGQDRSPDRDLSPAVWVAMSEGLADGVNNERGFDQQANYRTTLMSYHTDGLWQPTPPYFVEQPWLDFFGLNTWRHHDQVVANIGLRYQSSPRRPVVCFEQAYESANYFGEVMTPWHVRFQGYWCHLSGAVGYTYGEEPGYFVVASPDWPTYLQRDGRGDMIHLKAVLESRPLEGRIPDQSLIVSDTGDADRDLDYIAAARATDGSYAFVYSTNGRAFALDTTRLRGRRLQARWFNPREGTYEDLGTFTRRGALTFEPPGAIGPDNDWLLVVDAID